MLKKSVSKTQGVALVQKKNFFVKSLSPLINSYNAEELPEEGTISENVFLSRKTYTKWFNPNHFDPRQPDYVNAVNSTWDDEATREEWGECK